MLLTFPLIRVYRSSACYACRARYCYKFPSETPQLGR